MKVKIAKNGRKYLNLGCGMSFHKDWNNIDLIKNEDIIYYDLSKGIPFEKNIFDAVYASHLLEHLSYEQALNFIKEIKRVLTQGGIVRIVVPDLETICREYIRNLELVSNDSCKKNKQRYDWICLELLDQLVREKTGGMMLEYLKSGDFDKDYIIQRTGEELSNCFGQEQVEIDFAQKIKKFLKVFYRLFRKNNRVLDTERHKWMYDRYSLSELLKQAGFINIEVKNYNDSRVLNWQDFNLDKSLTGESARKPDSIYMEAVNGLLPK
jgi:predicted SAM-dependent methyltransferase